MVRSTPSRASVAAEQLSRRSSTSARAATTRSATVSVIADHVSDRSVGTGAIPVGPSAGCTPRRSRCTHPCRRGAVQAASTRVGHRPGSPSTPDPWLPWSVLGVDSRHPLQLPHLLPVFAVCEWLRETASAAGPPLFPVSLMVSGHACSDTGARALKRSTAALNG